MASIFMQRYKKFVLNWKYIDKIWGRGYGGIKAMPQGFYADGIGKSA